MKSIKLCVVFIFLLINFNCGENSVSKKEEPPKREIAEIKFQSENIDAGISDGKKNVKVDFRFKNTGNIPLIINEVKGNCHCVQGKWSDKPLAPGDSSVITVEFDPAGVSTSYQRTLMVHSNASRPDVQLYITGEIKRGTKEVIKKAH